MPNRPLRHAPARPADSRDDLVAASTLGELERHARAKAARDSYEFWNTGDGALLKRAFAENFADRAVWAVRAGNDGFAARQAARAARKGVDMNTLRMISEKWNAWRRYRAAVRELSQYSELELSDIGIRRCDIGDIVRCPVRRRTAT